MTILVGDLKKEPRLLCSEFRDDPVKGKGAMKDIKIFKTLYFDDLDVGDRWRTISKTVTETDMVTFNNLMGLLHPAFIDEEYIERGTLFKRRFASGVMIIPFVAGLFTQLHIIDDALLAMLSMTVAMKAPTFVGDTIYVEVEIVEKRETKSSNKGVVHFKYTPVNQKGEIVAEIIEVILVKREQPGLK